MKDLYSSLGLSPSSSLEAIRESIEGNASLVEAKVASQVLLNAQRKRVYDRAHATAARIGKLEVELRLPPDEPTRAFRTAAPGSWKELAVYAKANQPPPKKSSGWIFKLIVWAAIPGTLYLLSYLPRNPSTTATIPPTRPTPTPFKPTSTPFNQPIIAFPENGSFQVYTNKAMAAPLKIITQPGDSNDYYCKLINAQTGATEMILFVRGGFTGEFEVPLGTYKLRYACGYRWYGSKYLFGPSTTCIEGKNTVEFLIEGDQYKGNSIELYKRAGGNFYTEEIPLSDC